MNKLILELHIASQTETDLLKTNNLFALAVLAGLHVIKSKKNKGTAFQYKLKLMRLLLEGIIINKDENREYIQKYSTLGETRNCKGESNRNRCQMKQYLLVG